MAQDSKPAERPETVREPEKGTRLSAVEIHDNILAGATAEADRPSASLFWSALASGLAIAFSFLGSAFLSSLSESEPHKKALAAAAYPLGFIFVVVGRSELFTENTLQPVLPLLHERTAKRAADLARIWGILLLGNMIGALVFAWLLARTAMVPPALHESLRAVAETSTRGGFGLNFYQGIYGGWLIALMAWLLGSTSARGAQIALIWLCTAAISAFEFRHSIAGAVEAFYRAFAGTAGWGDMLGSFVVPAVLGNAVGGVVMVALLNYAQIKSELAPRPHTRE
jgi:formate/nitrite transporter FocA (FNT family)